MIQEFKEEYRWLSNFAPVSIILDGVEYPTVEHAYMSAKSDDKEWKLFCSDPNNKPGAVKRKSRKIELKENWNDLKIEVMTECIRQKFSQEPYRTNLIKTYSEEIQEGNFWGDKFWGICLKTNEGENNLGKIIMEFRKTLC